MSFPGFSHFQILTACENGGASLCRVLFRGFLKYIIPFSFCYVGPVEPGY